MKKCRLPQHRGNKFSTKDGFTLVELIVVIAVIAIVTAILLPVLHKAQQSAQNINCLSNLRQLQLCWHLYTVDNNDVLVPNNSVAFISQGTAPPVSDDKGVSWLPDVDASTEINPSNIISGLLFQYNSQLGIYHCPSDMSMLETQDGQPLNQLRWRSYNMSQSVNGYPGYDTQLEYYLPMWDKLMKIRAPTLSSAFVFIDEDSDAIIDAEFGNPPEYSPYFQQDVWWDLPSSRHNQGGNVSFADGHVEHWRWVEPKIFFEYVQPVAPGEMPDYQRVQNAMNQQLPAQPPGW